MGLPLLLRRRGVGCAITDSIDGNVAAGSTFTHEADCLIEFTLDSIPSGGSFFVSFRKQGAKLHEFLIHWLCVDNQV